MTPVGKFFTVFVSSLILFLVLTKNTQANNPLDGLPKDATRSPSIVIYCKKDNPSTYNSITACNGVVCATHYPNIQKRPLGFDMILKEVMIKGYNLFIHNNCKSPILNKKPA